MLNAAVVGSGSKKLGRTFAGIVLSTVLSAGAFVAPGFAAESSTAATASPFFGQVHQNFATWDLDHNGELSVEEVEKAVNNPAIQGEAAAAAASLRRAVRADKSLPPLTEEKIAASLKTTSTKEKPQPKYESMYESALKKITSSRKELFVEETPRLETVAQGRMGNCFLLASLGSCTHCDPSRLKSMFELQPNGRVLVKFGTGETMELDLPTDAELAIGASTANTGLWANMYEKAIGTAMLNRSGPGRYPTPISRISGGGTPSVPLAHLTGHVVRKHSCRDYRTPVDEKGASAADLDPLRKDLIAAFAEGRLVVGGCGPKADQRLVKGIVYLHSYGVLEYDAKTDTVLFWNPLGTSRTPDGPEGLENGYTVKHGLFRVPLKEAVMWFGSFSIETDEPYKAE
ncbi:MAG TPA: C2 family cysteine protease [Caulifigura sp.]|nr:C2 family cysteine protease [Caulifigura sp.]